ncbi:sulfotransferase [uncultured Roseovarius sp.]|uniref:sulfotransferase n=1 Tax=uncultured Roseovarius sp. TaxID=293344 RepID=UPI00260FA0DB|nr:sulfotransferase [uncultured Roseovarius sp.]
MKIPQLFRSDKKTETPDPVQVEKLFCISFQRTGTTSVGQFLKGLGYPVADWAVSRRNSWGRKWVEGQFDEIVESDDFRAHQGFEDGPWFAPEFYRFLYHRFPRSRFILFERDADAWFASMLSHSGGRSLGVTAVHAKIYRREKEYLDLCEKTGDPALVDENGLGLEGHKDHYIDTYRVRNRETRQFFHERDPARLYFSRLEDPDKWKGLASFLGHDPDKVQEVHMNKSPQPTGKN